MMAAQIDKKRGIYDQYGQQKLKEGIVDQKGNRILGEYTFMQTPQVVFEKFYGSKNVYEHLLEVGKGQGRSHAIFSAQYGDIGSIQAKNVANLIVPVQCKLSELFNGTKKTLTYSKNVLCSDGQTIKTVEQTKNIDITPGRSASCPIVFQGQGNQQAGQNPSNLVFEIIEVPEMGYNRSKQNPDDLVYTANISLMDALDSNSISVKQLSAQIIQLHFDEIICPQTQRTIEGKGMPRQNGKGRGDLLVRFNIEFPEQIEIGKKERIVELLRNAA